MNRKELAKRLARECGIVDNISTTINQTGENLLLVDWIDSAYRSILSMHVIWSFLYADFSFDTTIGKSEYTPAEAGITSFKDWIAEDVRCYLTDQATEQNIYFNEWDLFKRTFLFGASRTQTGRPSEFTIKPNSSLVVWQVPDDAYTITGNYYMAGESMTGDTSEPIFGEDYHMIIVWRAMLDYGAGYAEADKYAHGQNEYAKILKKMEFIYLPKIKRARALC